MVGSQAMGQQRFVGGEGVGADLQRLAKGGVWHVGDKTLQQHPHDVGVLPQVEGAGRFVLVKQVGGQGEGQRVAVGHAENALCLIFRHALAAQVGGAFVRAQVAQGDNAGQLCPAADAPGGGGGCRPAMITNARSGNCGRNSSRSQPSSGDSSS
jgi:hypothetical protein